MSRRSRYVHAASVHGEAQHVLIAATIAGRSSPATTRLEWIPAWDALWSSSSTPEEHLEIVREEGRLHPHADLLEDAAPGGGVASTGEHRGHACGKARGGQPAAVEIRGHTD